jgi:hypothetical protein
MLPALNNVPFVVTAICLLHLLHKLFLLSLISFVFLSSLTHVSQTHKYTQHNLNLGEI